MIALDSSTGGSCQKNLSCSSVLMLTFHVQRYSQVPSFGSSDSAILNFPNNVSDMKKLAARDFEDLLQVSHPPIAWSIITGYSQLTVLHTMLRRLVITWRQRQNPPSPIYNAYLARSREDAHSFGYYSETLAIRNYWVGESVANFQRQCLSKVHYLRVAKRNSIESSSLSSPAARYNCHHRVNLGKKTTHVQLTDIQDPRFGRLCKRSYSIRTDRRLFHLPGKLCANLIKMHFWPSPLRENMSIGEWRLAIECRRKTIQRLRSSNRASSLRKCGLEQQLFAKLESTYHYMQANR